MRRRGWTHPRAPQGSGFRVPHIWKTIQGCGGCGGAQDLQARRLRGRVPDRRGREAIERGVVGQRGGQLPRPVDAVLVHDVPDEAGHGNAAVLHLSMAQPADGRLVGLLPELALGQVQRVVVALRNGLGLG